MQYIKQLCDLKDFSENNELYTSSAMLHLKLKDRRLSLRKIDIIMTSANKNTKQTKTPQIKELHISDKQYDG